MTTAATIAQLAHVGEAKEATPLGSTLRQPEEETSTFFYQTKKVDEGFQLPSSASFLSGKRQEADVNAAKPNSDGRTTPPDPSTTRRLFKLGELSAIVFSSFSETTHYYILISLSSLMFFVLSEENS